MLVIYVHKSWLDQIGKVADLIVIQESSNEYVSILAASARVEFPFVEAKLVRRDVLAGQWLLPSSVPVQLVSGLFDLTREEAKNFGFHPHAKGK
jgi:hypothetical protein